MRALAMTSLIFAAAPVAHAAQTIRITKINGVDVPPDEVFVPNPPNDFFDIEWEAVDTDCNHGVNNMVTNVDSTGQLSSSGSGFSGTVQLDQGAFPLGCRHSIQIVANFRRPGLCGVLTTSVTSAPAAFWSSPYKDCVGPPSSCQEGSGQVGRPCDVATGKTYHEMTDLVIQGPLPIKFVRRYDSQSTLNGTFGYGWRHNYAMRVAAGGTNREVLTDAQGRQVYFNRLSAGIWDDNRIEHLSLTQGSPLWQVQDKYQLKYDFDGSGNLTTITDRNGNTLTLGYTGTDLTTVTDAFGRQVVLFYVGGHLQTLSAGTRTVTYSYTGDNLTRVDFPDTSFVTYEYDDPNEPVGNRHNMTAAKDKLGNVIESHSYYANDKIKVTQSDAGNYLYTLVYDSPVAGKTTVTNSRTFQTVYTLDTFSGLVKQSDGPGCTLCGDGGVTTTLMYDTFLNVTDITDGEGVLTHMTHDGNGNVLTRTEGSGARTWVFTYEEHSFLKSSTIPSVGTGACLAAHPDKIVTNRYRTMPSANGDLMEQKIEGCDGPTFFTNITLYDYDTHGQLALVNGPRTVVPDDTTMILYYADGDPDFNKRARLHLVTNALGHETTYAGYDLFGNVGSVTDPNSVETAYLYDGKDRLTSATLVADAITTENQYDDVGNLYRVRFPNCVQIGASCLFSLEYVYDTVNRLKEIHDAPALGNKIVYSYDTEGNQIREEYRDVADVPQRYTNFEYDNLNRLQRVCHGAPTPLVCGPVFTQYTYYGDGRRQTEQDPEGHVTTFVYDALKRLRTVTQTVDVPSTTTTYGYDGQDNLASVMDPVGLLTTYTNSDLGWRLTTTSPDTGVTSHEYDPAGNLRATTNAIPVLVNRTYDSLNRLLTVTYPTPSLNVTYSYDAADVPPGTFFNVGRRTMMTDPSGTSAYHYNRRGLLKQENKTIGSTTYTTQYDYDKTGNLKQILYPTESPLLRQGEVDYEYDLADQVSLVTTEVNGVTAPVADTFAYKPFGPRTGMRFGNLLVDDRSYGFRYQLGSWTLGSVLDYTHAFDNDLNLTGRTDNLNAGNNRGFGYDGVHRLTQASAAGLWGPGDQCGGVTYTYDLNGNRQCKGEDATSTNYQYVVGKNRLDTETTGATTTTYSYSNTGNIDGETTGSSTRTYQYNDTDRLSAVVDPGPTTIATYTYDGDGRRVAKTSGITTNYFYDPNGRLLTEIVAASGIGKDYMYLVGDPLARVDWSLTETALSGSPGPLLAQKASPSVHFDWANASGGSGSYVVRRKQVVNPSDKTFNGSTVIASVVDPTRTYDDPVLNDANRYDYKVFRKTSNDVLSFYHTDHLGTPIAMTNGIGAPVWRAEHLPFGGLFPGGLAMVPNNLRFPGQYFDSETGLHQNWFRDYAPRMGRYLEADPIGLLAGIAVYSYSLGNPLYFVDPLGLLEGSPSNLQKRLAIAAWAAAQNVAADAGSTAYSHGSYLSEQYPSPSWKCSGFVCVAANTAGAQLSVNVPTGTGGTTTRCPTAIELSRGHIPLWRELRANEAPRPGDIAAAPLLRPDPPRATGHAAVMISDGSGGVITLGAHHDRVGPPGADQFSRLPTFLRYTGD